VCRRSYIHPAVIDSYLDGTLRDRWADASARGPRQVTTEERKTLSMLERSGR